MGPIRDEGGFPLCYATGEDTGERKGRSLENMVAGNPR